MGTWPPPDPDATDFWGRARSPPRGFLAAVSFSLLSRSRSLPVVAACWNAVVLDNHVGTCNAPAIAVRGMLQGGLPPQVLKGDVMLQVVKSRANIAARRVGHYVGLCQGARKIFGHDSYVYVRSPLHRANAIKVRPMQLLRRGPFVGEPTFANHAFVAHSEKAKRLNHSMIR